MNKFNEIKSCVGQTIVDYGGNFLFNRDYKIVFVEDKKLFKIWTYDAEPFRFFSGIRTKIKAQLKKQFGLKGYVFEVGQSKKTDLFTLYPREEAINISVPKKEQSTDNIVIPEGFKLVKIPRRHKRVNFVFDDETYNKLKRVSKNNSVSMNELINQMIGAIKE